MSEISGESHTTAIAFTAVARDLGIDHNLLRGWKKQLSSDSGNPFPGKGNPHDPDLAQLKREVARLKEENAILKKVVAILTAPSR